MNWKTTWMLLALASLLFVFIVFVERRLPGDWNATRAPAKLVDFTPEKLTGLQLRRTNQLVLRLEQTNGVWNMTFPIQYRAQQFAITGLLQLLAKLDRQTYISPEELRTRHQSISHFGLDIPSATLTLQLERGRQEIMFGSKTPVGDRVYVRLDDPGVYVVEGQAFDLLPKAPNDWRDTALVDLAGFKWDRLEFRTPTRGYALQADVTNQTFLLSKPTPARADRSRVESLLRTVGASRILEFVNDNPRTELESYGLQAPQAELVFGLGTNDLAVFHFGNASTNRPGAVFVRDLARTNVVLMPQALLDGLLTTHADLREKRLLTFAQDQVDTVEVNGETGFVMNRAGESGWSVVAPEAYPADPRLVGLFFELAGQLKGEVERDVVTDFSPYGLVSPSRQFLFKSSQTNATGTATNRLVAQLDVGAPREDSVYVRRSDEPTVFSIPRVLVEQLPVEGWQLRDRKVWGFGTNDVRKVTLRLPEGEANLVRSGPAQWDIAPGSQGVINDLAIEETMHRLGGLEAEFWVDRGERNRARFGFDERGYKIVVALQQGTNQLTRSVEFGGVAPSQFPYAEVELEGQPMIIEFPKKLHFELWRDLFSPFSKTKAPPP